MHSFSDLYSYIHIFIDMRERALRNIMYHKVSNNKKSHFAMHSFSDLYSYIHRYARASEATERSETCRLS